MRKEKCKAKRVKTPYLMGTIYVKTQICGPLFISLKYKAFLFSGFVAI